MGGRYDLWARQQDGDCRRPARRSSVGELGCASRSSHSLPPTKFVFRSLFPPSNPSSPFPAYPAAGTTLTVMG